MSLWFVPKKESSKGGPGETRQGQGREVTEGDPEDPKDQRRLSHWLWKLACVYGWSSDGVQPVSGQPRLSGPLETGLGKCMKGDWGIP